jgi:hypothetical protein
MKARLLAALGLAVSLAVNACAAASTPITPTVQLSAATPPTATMAPTDTHVPPSPTPVPPTAPAVVSLTKAPASALAPGVGPAGLRATIMALSAAKSYRINATSTGAGQTQLGTVLVEVVKPDRVHTRTQRGNQTIESITVGQDFYINYTGKWQKMTIANNPLAAFLLNSDPQKILDQMDTAQTKNTVTKGAITQVDGTRCQEWIMTPVDPAKTGGSFCVNVSNGLPVQWKSADGKIVVTYSDWNAAITIEPPAL